MGKQSELFRQHEGEAWLKRNEHQLPPKTDPVIDIIAKLNMTPDRVLEIGCANGWRLDKLKEKYDCMVTDGIDPCIGNPHRTKLHSSLIHGTAEKLPVVTHRYDTIIYGFCLYLCDPEDYFKIVEQGDGLLQDTGRIIIYDFHSTLPHSRPYVHQQGVMSRKMDFARLWLGHPSYSLEFREIIGEGDNRTAVTVLLKDTKAAFPVKHD